MGGYDMNTYRRILILAFSVLTIALFTGCASGLKRQIIEKDNKIALLQTEISDLKKDHEIKIFDSFGRETSNVNLYDPFGVKVSGFAPNATYAFSLKTKSRTIIRDDIIIETNQLGKGRNFLVWNGLDDYENLTDTLKKEIENGVTIEVKQTRGSTKNIETFLPSQLVYTSDNNGKKKNSFIQLHDSISIFLTLENFPQNSNYTVYLTRRANWYQGRPIFDLRNFQGQLIKVQQEKTLIKIWERDGMYGWANGNLCGGFNIILTKGEKSIAHFDTATCQIYNSWGSLFVIQRFSKEDRAQNLTRYGEEYRPNDLMRIGVDPKNGRGEQPGYLIHAFMYFVQDTVWTDGLEIRDDAIVLADDITIRPGCTNVNQHTVPVPYVDPKIIARNFDIIIDINNDKKYTKGIDIIDGIDGPGFKVVHTPQTIIATIWEKINSFNEQYGRILKVHKLEEIRRPSTQERKAETLQFKVTPNVPSSYFPSNNYRYDKLDSIKQMLEIFATEIVEYLNDYEVEYIIKCVGNKSDVDTLRNFSYPQYPDDELEIEYCPSAHSPFRGSDLLIKGKGDEGILIKESLARLRGFYLYRDLLLRGVLADCIGIGSSDGNDLKPYLKITVVYRSS